MPESNTSFTPIAIIGMGCRFPEAPNVDAYWRMLLDGVDAITDVPASRWDADAFYDPRPATPCKVVTRRGGFLKDVDRFDPYFFGISPREAVRLDPQQRLLLEVTWNAMENAGMPRERFMGSHTGVFVGVCTDDYITLERGDLRNIDIYLGTGGSRGSTAGRLAFTYGLSGPVAAIDTACSSSLVAVHQACHSLLAGDCAMALAGGVNVVLHPGTAVAFSQANMLSPDGRCKAFDSSADGFVRSEGAGVVLLKPLAAALAEGDPVYAVIRATASNNDGSSSPFMTPSRTGQAALLRHAYLRAGISPDSVQYVEAHGTGTEVGDPIEVGALADVIGADRTGRDTIYLGSSKTNVGHMEAAAGVAGLIKAALCIHHRTIPPNLHFVTPNPDIPWAELPFQVPVKVTAWPDDGRVARAGVNSFGISGTNAHVVLEQAPLLPANTQHVTPHVGVSANVVLEKAISHLVGTHAVPPDGDRDAKGAISNCSTHDTTQNDGNILLLSAHTSELLQVLAASYTKQLNDNNLSATVHDVCYTAAVRRSTHEHRVGIVCSSREELLSRLNGYVEGSPADGVVAGIATSEFDQQPVFVFSGIGTQRIGMGRELANTEYVFREALQECDECIRSVTGWSVIEEMNRRAPDSLLSRIDYMQPAIFSIQVALAALWKSWGVEPRAAVGHSLGEIAAAYVAGALTLGDAARVVCERSRLMHRKSGLGKMAAVGLSRELLQQRLSDYSDRVSIAVMNAPDSCTVSGDADVVEEIARSLDADGIFCRVLNVDVACHSHHMQSLAEELSTSLHDIAPRVATVPLYSTLLGRVIEGPELDGEYWARNLREPVDFQSVTQRMMRDGYLAFLEISPTPSLATPLRRNAKSLNQEVLVAGSLRPDAGERASLLANAGYLHVNGAPIDWKRVYPAGRFVAPPAYVWPGERFWFEEGNTVGDKMEGRSNTLRQSAHPLLGIHWEPADHPGTHCFEATLDLNKTAWLGDHRVEEMPLFPAAGYIELALAASAELFGSDVRVVRDVEFKKPLFLSYSAPTTIQLVVTSQQQSGVRVTTSMTSDAADALSFQCYARAEGRAESDRAESGGWQLMALGVVECEMHPGAAMGAAGIPETHDAEIQLSPYSDDELNAQFEVHRTGSEFYGGIASGMEFGPGFQGVQRAWGRRKHAVTLIRLSPTAAVDARHFRLHPALLDACFHSLNAVPEKSPKFSLPVSMERMIVHRLPDAGAALWCEIHMSRTNSGFSATLHLSDNFGRRLIDVMGYQCMQLDSKTKASPTEGWLYETRWELTERTVDGEVRNGAWLVIGDDNTSHELIRSLKERGCAAWSISANASREELQHALINPPAFASVAGVVYVPQPPENDAECCGAGADLGVRDASCDAMSGRELQAVATTTSTGLLNVLQLCAAEERSVPPRVFVLTTNAKDVALGDAALNIAHAPLAGLMRVAAIEFRALHPTQCDISGDVSVEVIADELLHADEESEIALRPHQRYALRLQRPDVRTPATTYTTKITDAGSTSYRLESAGTGVLTDLHLSRTVRRAPGRGEVEIRVAAVALNFLDVLKALNMAPGLPEGARFFGMECSGRVVRVGEGVTALTVGDEVLALDTSATGCFSAFITTSAGAILPMPPGLTSIQAVTIPIAYQTAWYALNDLARLRRGESVLIHSAAGGVGLAAVEIARQRGATIFATAGTEEKRAYLHSLGIERVMNSRSLEFAKQVMQFTLGRGVDVVLNSLAGEAIPASLGVLATGGRFVEIGKRDIYADSQLGMLPFQRNLSFFAVDLLRMRMEKPEIVEELTRDVAAHLADGTFKPLPFTTFSVTESANAFRHMANGTHIGKIVVTLDEGETVVVHEESTSSAPQRSASNAPTLDSDASYVVTGGLGALGLVFARQLVDKGARHIALLGRSAANAPAVQAIEEMRKLGATVSVFAADVSDAHQLRDALRLVRSESRKIKGVLHAAGVTDDRTLLQMKPEHFDSVYRAKISGAWNLHMALRDDPLDFFVLFSSAASILGGGGQANYAAANAFMDSLAHFRRRANLPALSVNWGPWADVGMAALDDNRGARLADRGLASIQVADGVALLDGLLQRPTPQIAVMPIDWRRWAEVSPTSLASPFLSAFASAGSGSQSAVTHADVRVQVLSAASRESALQILHTALRTDVARILRISEERINLKVSIVRFGLDSLMAVELKNRIDATFHVNLSAARLLQGPSISELSEWMLGELTAAMPMRAEGTALQTGLTAPVSVDELTDEEVSRMLDELLAKGR